MTAVNPPAWLENGSHHAVSGRRLPTGQLLAGGVWHPTDFTVTATGTNMVLTIGSGGATVMGTSVTRQGGYGCYNDASVTRTAKVGGAGVRTDLIIAQVHDGFVATPTNTDANSNYNMPSANTWDILLVDGTSVAPAVPTAPASSIVLYQVTVGAGVTSLSNGNLADVRQPVIFRGGGVVAVTSTARPTNWQGQISYETDTSKLTFYDGTTQQTLWDAGTWLPYTPVITGSTSGGAMGNATGVVARYRQSKHSCVYQGEFVLGTTTSFGVGALRISLPVTARGTTPSLVGTGEIDDVSTGNRYQLMAKMDTTSALSFRGGTNWAIVSGSLAQPMSFAAGDYFGWEVEYEI